MIELCVALSICCNHTIIDSRRQVHPRVENFDRGKWREKQQKEKKLQSEAGKKKIALPPGLVGQLGKTVAAEFAPIPSNIYQCMDISCMCTYLRGLFGLIRLF